MLMQISHILDNEFLNNTIRQYLWLGGVLLVVVIFNKYLSSFISRILFQLLKWTRFGEHGKLFLKLTLRPLEAYLILHTLYIGFSFLDAPDFMSVTFLGVTLLEYVQGIYQLLFIINTGWLFSRIADFIITVMNEKALLTPDPTDDQVIGFLKDVLRVVIWTTVVLCILGFVFHVNVTSIVAGAGIAGVAIAFAAQETLQNIFGSISLFSEKPFIVGELVEVDGIIGTVDKVGFRSTRVRALDKSYMTIPNKNIVNNRINNLTNRTARRVQFLLGVEYGTSTETIETIVDEIRSYLESHPAVLDQPVVQFFEFGPSSLNIWIEYFIHLMEWVPYLAARQEIMLQLMRIVQDNGASFAFPSQTVYVRPQQGET
ncbi:MAG: hypothetical protein ABR94_07965, partial [Sphingobacteriales bacterium BACL12 MAG-120802-bin5]